MKSKFKKEYKANKERVELAMKGQGLVIDDEEVERVMKQVSSGWSKYVVGLGGGEAFGEACGHVGW